MKITDNTGMEIEIDNLQLALLQADDFRHYRLGGAEHKAYNEKQTACWEDIYQQLLKLANENP